MKQFQCALIMVAAGVAGCVHSARDVVMTAPPEVVQSTERYRKEYVLAPGDQLEVVVYRNPELSKTIDVRYDGFISLPLVDDIRAAGMTVPELDELLTDLYSKRLVDPEVTIIVRGAHEPTVYVVGEVGGVKPVPLRQAKTAAQALAESGGVQTSAGKGHVAIVRLDDEGRLVAHLLERPARGQTAFYMALQNTPLQPDDLIVVPESGRSQFVRFVNDFVNTPLSGVNQALAPYFQYKIIKEIEDSARRQRESVR
jgi:polysaccharide biosynthesis/export protein